MTGETYGPGDKARRRDMIVGLIATLYGVWLVYAAGLSYLLMCSILFVPGILVYARARREAGTRAFNAPEAVIAVAILALGLCAAWLLWTGRISPF